MELVRTRFHRNDTDPARAVAKFGVDGILHHGVLGHGVHRRRITEFVARDQRRAIEENVVAILCATAQVHFICGPVVVGLGLDRAPAIDDGRIEQRQLEGIPSRGGKLAHHFGLDRQVAARSVELYGHRRVGDGDRLVDCPGFHFEVGGHIAALLYQDIALDELLEATHVGCQGVGSRIDVVKEVATFSVGYLVDFHVSGIVLQDDRYARNHRAR